MIGVSQSAQALVLDWSTVLWTPGTLSNSYDVDPANPGTDITVTIGGDTNTLQTDPTTGIQTPAITSSLEGGTSPVEPSLQVAARFVPPRKLTFTIDFSGLYAQGVTSVSFTIFNIDGTSGTETIRSITADGIDGTTTYAATITNLGSAVQLNGAGLGQSLKGIASVPMSGAGSGDGNATISFGLDAIQSVTFTFADTPGSVGLLMIALSNISFTPIPEIDPTWCSAALCAMAVATLHLLRRRAPQASPPETSPVRHGPSYSTSDDEQRDR
ncbi:MAG: large repetitive protein [Verrucomicrobiota bacterium]